MDTQINVTEEYVKKFIYKYEKYVDTKWVDLDEIVKNVFNNVPAKLIKNDFYNYVADYCVAKSSKHPDYNKLASRICVDRLHKTTPGDFLDAVEILYNNDGSGHPLVSKNLLNNVRRFHKKLSEVIDIERDYLFDYFGIKTLERSYLLKIHTSNKKKQIIERPQYLIMRVSLGIHGANIDAVIETYEYISNRYFTHATPTLFNSGTNRNQLSSCFLENTEVFTLNDGIKFIQDVKIGDEIVTHTGKSQKVTQLHKNLLGERDVYKLNVVKTKDVYVTGNHKFYCSTDKKTSEWKAIDELKSGDYIAIPNYSATKNTITIDVNDYLKDYEKTDTVSIKFDKTDKIVWETSYFTHSNLIRIEKEVTVTKKSSEINRYWKLSNDFMNLIGMFLGDGNIISKTDKKGITEIFGIAFTVFDKNTKEIDFIKKTGEDVFGIKSSIHTMKNQNIIQVMFNSRIIGITFNKLFGKGFEGKRIPNLFNKLPTNVIHSLLAGLITTDGCISKESIITLQMSNKILMDQLYHLFRNRGIDVSLHAVKTPSKLATVEPWLMNIPKISRVLDQTYKYYEDDRLEDCYKKIKAALPNKTTPITINKTKFLRIDSIEKTELKPEFVYTLGVENDHSYNVEGLVCENCYLLSMDDSLESIMHIASETAKISKYAGGIGISLSSIRAKNSIIRGTNGQSEGIVPLCGVLNKLSRYVNQGGKRPGSIACYLEPYHADIYEFMELRKANSGNEENRAKDLFLASWIPDLFMKRVENDQMWSLMCPNECPNLDRTHGEEFEALYTKYEKENKFRKQVRARDLWNHLLECQIETGFTYMCYKDHANNKSNQKNLGTIRCSNLCAEIMQYTDANTIAVCNLASICLPRFVYENNGEKLFNYDLLERITRVIVRNLNKVIDVNFYPTESTEKSNKRQRPIGLGIQGLSNAYNMMQYAYDSPEAELLNRYIFETIYFAAIDESKELAKKFGHYVTFKGSPFSQGKLQFHLWGLETKDLLTKDKYNWDGLIKEVQEFGTRNSLLTALMPTAGTSQLMSCYESFEPFISNIFVKTTMAGEFIVINESLVHDLIKLNLWSDDMRKLIIINNGSVQNIDTIPQKVKDMYKTAFEIKLKSMIKQSAERGPFIDQSQSLNLFMKTPDPTVLTSAHFYAWKSGLKTGMYYLRSNASINPIQFGIDIADVIRLTGRSSALELIAGDMNLTKEVEPSENKTKRELDLVESGKACKYIPGQSAEGCIMCSG